MSLETISVTSLERPWMCAPSPMVHVASAGCAQQQEQEQGSVASRSLTPTLHRGASRVQDGLAEEVIGGNIISGRVSEIQVF